MQSSPALHYHIPDLTHPPPRAASHCWTWAAGAQQQREALAAMVSKQLGEVFPRDQGLPLARCPWPCPLTCPLTPYRRAHRQAPPIFLCLWALLRGPSGGQGLTHRGVLLTGLMFGATFSATCQGTALPMAHLAALPHTAMLCKGHGNPSQIFW